MNCLVCFHMNEANNIGIHSYKPADWSALGFPRIYSFYSVRHQTLTTLHQMDLLARDKTQRSTQPPAFVYN